MTKEQEEAIERLEKRIKDNEDYKTTQVWLTDDVSAVYTVLNMLKEKDVEIEELKANNESTWKLNARLTHRHLSDIFKIKQKDKQIDLILDKLNENYTDVFKNNEVKGIIEIYEKIKNTSNLSGIKLRKECIKQYFERQLNSSEQN